MTTTLAGEDTHFLPFNRGTEDGGAGNPLNPDGSPSAYLWERVLQRDSLAEHPRPVHVHQARDDHRPDHRQDVEVSDACGFRDSTSGRRSPNVTAAVTSEGVGHRYLIQHSAGSGKTDSIAWTAHRMARLQVDNEKVFDSVIVVTDRNVLDAQLQDAIKQIDNDQGIVVAIDRDEATRAGGSKSGLLAKALTDGKLIIVVTIQTFPFAMAEIRENKGLEGKTFAVIADEAHSSQSGQVASQVESRPDRRGAEGDRGRRRGRRRSDPRRRSHRTGVLDQHLLLRVHRHPEGQDPGVVRPHADAGTDLPPVSFHVYTMRQAIEERYILDVLTGYHSFKLAFQIGQNAASGGGEVDQAQATKQVMRWVKLNPQTIAQKAAIIVEHFRENVARLLDGHAKAMVVTDSRKAAVRYKLAIDKFIAKKGYGYGTLVAFSGTVQDPESGPDDFTEANMNPGVHDLRTSFRGDQYKVMIVANKFQTGFDQPLLCAMYVDRILSGVTAVQTLSRLNRTYVTPSGMKKTAGMTQVVDFVNEPDDIQAAFRAVLHRRFPRDRRPTRTSCTTSRASSTHPASTRRQRSTSAPRLIVKAKGNNALAAAIGPGKKRFAERYNAALIHNGGEGDKAALAELDMFRKDVGSFVRLYDFM